VFSFSHLTYLVQLLYPGKLLRPKCHEMSLTLVIFSVLQYQDIKCKTVTFLFYTYLLLNLNKRTMTRFIAQDKIVDQSVWWEMRLASDNSWARRRLTNLSWRLRWIILYTFDWKIPVHATPHELISAFLACPSDWAQGPPPLCAERGVPLPACRMIVPVLWILFSRLSMLPSFQLSSGNLCNSLHAPYGFDRQRFFKNQNRIFQ